MCFFVCRTLPGGRNGISSVESEFPSLAQFLGLIDGGNRNTGSSSTDGDGDEQMDTSRSSPDAPASVCDGLNWFHFPESALSRLLASGLSGASSAERLPELAMWLGEFRPVVHRAGPPIARQLLMVQLLWKQPRLLAVPNKYDTIFQFYHKRPCRRCGNVPKDPTVCLMCGTMVCLKEPCCKSPPAEGGVCETVAHAQDCGGGTGVFLAVNSSTIVVIRGKRACIWGSIYLDSFGEEDKELK